MLDAIRRCVALFPRLGHRDTTRLFDGDVEVLLEPHQHLLLRPPVVLETHRQNLRPPRPPGHLHRESGRAAVRIVAFCLTLTLAPSGGGGGGGGGIFGGAVHHKPTRLAVLHLSLRFKHMIFVVSAVHTHVLSEESHGLLSHRTLPSHLLHRLPRHPLPFVARPAPALLKERGKRGTTGSRGGNLGLSFVDHNPVVGGVGGGVVAGVHRERTLGQKCAGP